MKLSKRQQAIIDEWKNTDNSIVISAVAGSGKTTTLMQLLEICEYKTLFVAFNKSIQEEIQSRIDKKGLKQGKALTMHSLGFLSLRNNYKKVRVTANKGFNLVMNLQKKKKGVFGTYMPFNVKSQLTMILTSFNDLSRIHYNDDYNYIMTEYLKSDSIIYNNNFDKKDLEELWDLFVKEREDSYEGDDINIDFTDMIYLPLIKDFDIPINPIYLMIDEAQDLNLCQHMLIKRLISQGDVEKFIAVGDRNQSIYGFAGADAKSFDKFLEYDNTIELPLDICYRCPKSIIDESNRIYNVMEYGNDNDGIVGKESDVSLIKDNSLVVSRHNLPILRLYFKLILKGRNAALQNDEIIKSIFGFLKPFRYDGIDAAMGKMTHNLTRLESKFEKKGNEKNRIAYYTYKKRVEEANLLLTSVPKHNQFATIQNLMDTVTKVIRCDKNADITLTSIHKAKGLEADVVYILDYESIPSQMINKDIPEQMTQEENLKYVAITRAKKELYYLSIN